MAAVEGERQFAVHLEWLDPHSQLLRPFHLKYFEVDGTLEIYDTRQKRMFLKRVAPPENTQAKDLYVGNVVTIFSRKMKVTAYADERTARYFAAARTTSMALIVPRLVRRLGEVLQGMLDAGLEVGKLRMLRWNVDQARGFLALSKGTGGGSASALAEGPVVAVELVAADCHATASALARSVPGVRVAPSAKYTEAELEYCFSGPQSSPALHRDCTVCVIRPYMVAAGKAPALIRDIQAAGFSISAASTVQFSAGDASDFLDAYRGVLPHMAAWARDLESGPAVCLELVGEDVAAKFRQLCGPYNPDVARLLRPDTLRAKYGEDCVRNAVHCTDLTTDGPLESKFVFHVIPQYASSQAITSTTASQLCESLFLLRGDAMRMPPLFPFATRVSNHH